MWIDYRSDTVTKPSKEMKEFMFDAEVGDDVFGEDPTINALEKYAASLFGKEAGLFCSSGTQTNQIAIQVYCKPGDEVICSKEAHIYKYEGGGIAKNAGSSVKLLDGDRGRISAQDIKKVINDPENVHYPLTALVALEDTMNRGGGAIYDFQEIQQIRALCNEHHLPLHLDGARVFNSLVETGIDFKTYGDQFDSISICLSKGLGAPVGSVLIGSTGFIKQARRIRKVLGGGMRQAGIIAAGGLYALQHNINRLKIDHESARKIGQALEQMDIVEKVLPVDSNIVVAVLNSEELVPKFIDFLKDNNILAMPFDAQQVRFVSHLDISDSQVLQTIEILQKCPL